MGPSVRGDGPIFDMGQVPSCDLVQEAHALRRGEPARDRSSERVATESGLLLSRFPAGADQGRMAARMERARGGLRRLQQYGLVREAGEGGML